MPLSGLELQKLAQPLDWVSHHHHHHIGDDDDDEEDDDDDDDDDNDDDDDVDKWWWGGWGRWPPVRPRAAIRQPATFIPPQGDGYDDDHAWDGDYNGGDDMTSS